MLTITALREYLNLPPDAEDSVAELCLNAAKSKARTAGIPDYQNNAEYDLFLCALAACWYDNRGMRYIASGSTATAEEAVQKMINSFVLGLRHAEEDETKNGEIRESR